MRHLLEKRHSFISCCPNKWLGEEDSCLVTPLDFVDFDLEIFSPSNVSASTNHSPLPFSPAHIMFFGKNSGISRLSDSERVMAKTFRTGTSHYYIRFGSLPYTPPLLKVREGFVLDSLTHPLCRIHFEVVKSGRHNYIWRVSHSSATLQTRHSCFAPNGHLYQLPW